MQDFNSKRLGIHYYADTTHYHTADLQRWLPRLSELGISWMVLQAPIDRAIPEEFITSLINANIQPILHFQPTLDQPTPASALATLFKAYASWGVRYVVFYDRPNLRSQWPGSGWTQRGLVDRFLDMFTPLAHAAQLAGLSPVFPALEPGGDYWDTAFLRASLETLVERGDHKLLEKLAIGAYAWTEDKSLDWGQGGPEAWPATLPYHTPAYSEDQRGFRIFDWYNAVSMAAVGTELPILILAAGVQREVKNQRDAQPSVRYIKMAEIVQKNPGANTKGAMPNNVLACNFWLLAADSGELEKQNASAWFHANGRPTTLGEKWLAFRNGIDDEKGLDPEGVLDFNPDAENTTAVTEIIGSTDPEITIGSLTGAQPQVASASEDGRAIRHYLLLPNAADWPLERIQSYVMEHEPTIGYSAEEAQRAARVTLAGGLQSFSDELLRNLIAAGCQVENLPAAS